MENKLLDKFSFKILDNILEMVVVIDNIGNIVYINNSCNSFLQVKESVNGKHIDSVLFIQQYHNRLIEKGFFAKAINLGQSIMFKEIYAVINDIQIPIIDSFTPIVDEDTQKIIGYSFIFREIIDLKNHNDNLQRRNKCLEQLHEISMSIAKTNFDPSSLIQFVLEQTVKMFNTHSGCVFLLNDDKNKLVLTHGIGVHIFDINREQDIFEGVVGESFKSKKPIKIDNYQRYEKKVHSFAGLKISSTIVSPIYNKHESIGVMVISSIEDKFMFDENDIFILQEIADMLSTSLENLNLHNTVTNELKNNIAIKQELEQLLIKDPLTNIYNRTYFLQFVDKYSINENVGIVLLDVDGLKLINNAFGHLIGDFVITTIANIMTKISPTDSIKARLGGDEFVIVVFDCKDVNVLIELSNKIYQEIESYNIANYNHTPPISVSIGYALSEINEGIKDVFDRADNNLYKEKLLSNKSHQNSITQVIIKMMEMRDFETSEHLSRLSDLMEKFSRYIGIPEDEVSTLLIFAKFHDIGKVGISDTILLKPGKLTEDEMNIMKKHSEIGYEIAKSSQELQSISEYILYHHERWDGNGYPLKKKGDETPLYCRMLAICDAFDAMTSDRPYRTAMSQEDAFKEIMVNSGSQFDPKLAEQFVNLMKV